MSPAVETDAAMWHCPVLMTTRMTNLTHKRTLILSVLLLLAVIASGFWQVELPTHSAADFGDIHNVHDYSGIDGADFSDIEELGNNGVMHLHDIGAPALALVSVFGVILVAQRLAGGRTPPPTASPPDDLITPLYRPPIV